MVMENLEEQQIKTIEDMWRQFIWNGKKPKISIKTMQQDKKKGGLRLCNIRAKQDAIKIGWIFKLDEDQLLAECAYHMLDTNLRNLLWRCNLEYSDCLKSFGNENFWSQMLTAWSKINFERPANRQQVLDQIIWYNSFVKIDKKVIMWKQWFEKGILWVSDIFKDGAFLNAETLGVNWLDHASIMDAIPLYWKSLLQEAELGSPSSQYTELSKCKSRNRKIYDLLIYDPFPLLKYYNKWLEVPEFSSLEYAFYEKCFARLYCCTDISKYRDFQYRLLLGKIFTNNILYEWGIVDDAKCTFCGNEPENLMHLLWSCSEVKPLIDYVQWLCKERNIVIELNSANFILNYLHESSNHVINFVGILVKQFIYRCRCMKKVPKLEVLKLELEFMQSLEWANAKVAGRTVKHTRRWSPIFDFETNPSEPQ